MPSSEKIISPGVFTNEIDQSFLPAAIGEIGAAVVGPTVKGPILIPTVVSSYSEYQRLFGDSVQSGSSDYTYLTSMTAREYLKNGNRLTVVRVAAGGGFQQAFASIPTGGMGAAAGGQATAVYNSEGSGPHEDPSVDYQEAGTDYVFKLRTHDYGVIMNNGGGHGGHVAAGGAGAPEKEQWAVTQSGTSLLVSASEHSVRWEVSNVNAKKGTFALLVRKGTDTHKRKQILETWNNLSLDPDASNYLEKVIGNQKIVQGGSVTNPYISVSGSSVNKSKYVYVSEVNGTHKTPQYLNTNGEVRVAAASASLPATGSGSYWGTFRSGSAGYNQLSSLGEVIITGSAGPQVDADGIIKFYDEIADTNTQGFDPDTAGLGGDEYKTAINLLKNQDEYDINMLLLPGIISSKHTDVSLTAIDMVEERGDCFLVLDPVIYGSNLTEATSEAELRDTSYSAMYWPWVQVNEPAVGRNVWVPASTVMGGIYAFNDRVSHPWFAPAGLNRGGIDSAIQAERKLTQTNRDDLYNGNVNPIATFPGQGICVWGQKTLQKKSSALDRVNVRRLLIKLKKFIASTSRFLVFEQNNPKTRARFLNVVNPYLEQVQSQSGLSAFKVVMDDTNNPPETIDRNILYGQILIQPTRTAEFIVVDFTVQSTGAAFPE